MDLLVPDEILLHVFQYLPAPELALRAGRVCSQWRRIARDSGLWSSQVLRYARAKQDEFVSTLQFAPALKCLDYSGYTDKIPDRVCRAMVKGVRRVKRLEIQTTNKTESSVLKEILCHYKDHLQELSLFVNSNLVSFGTDDSLDAETKSQDLSFLTAIGQMPELRTLVLKGAWRCYDSHADVASGCPKLHTLDISGLRTDFFDEHECPFFVMLLRNKRLSLTCLRLSGCYIHPSILTEVAKLENLREITVTVATLGVIKNMANLATLNIRGYGCTDSFFTNVSGHDGDVRGTVRDCRHLSTLKQFVLQDVEHRAAADITRIINEYCPALRSTVVCMSADQFPLAE